MTVTMFCGRGLTKRDQTASFAYLQCPQPPRPFLNDLETGQCIFNNNRQRTGGICFGVAISVTDVIHIAVGQFQDRR